ncbi:hypothetical protein EUGRSUZ_J01516 [Eucalyptus grandis]|uniref:Uncharacterized protein n=2 Tax=Eucalyptus grandis TaxID=71139 RepID=A0ACC3J680_EUCGR|nr:hypothetical protein EUGRSUZ_J01516 [Eucalyptus grandis]
MAKSTNFDTLLIYQWNSDNSLKSKLQDDHINLKEFGPMVHDALIKIKNEINSSLPFDMPVVRKSASPVCSQR